MELTFIKALEPLKKFYNTSFEERTVVETKKENIPEEWKQLLDTNYIRYSDSVIRTINDGKGYCILTPTRKGKFFAGLMGLQSLLH